MKKHITAILLLLACTILSAQENGVKVKVTDDEGMPVAGAVISVKGNPAPVLTDKKGEATVYAMIGDNLTVTLFNRYYSETTVDSENMYIQFSRNDLLLDIGYDRKVSKKYSSMSIDGAGSSDIEVARDRSVLNSVNGLIPGLYVSPAYNVPWFPTPNVYVRGKGSYNGNGVKYFIDGIERDPSLVNSEEVESVTVLKDAAALAIYGVRGADGIVLITTKRGSDGAMRIKTDYNFAVATPYDMPRMASAADYAAAVNEALANDGLAPRYSMNDINALRNGTSKYIPDVDWQKEMLRSTAFTHDFNISLDGAEKRMRYYVYGNFNSYRGLLNNTESNEGYSTQLQMSNLRLRTNLEADVTKTTKLRLNMMGDLNQYQEPASGYYLSGIYDTPAAAFPAKAEDGTWIRSTMFANPLATLTASGYNVYLQRSLYADISIDQDMSAITEGLSLQIKANYDNSANIKDSHTRSYAYYNLNYQYDAAGIFENAKAYSDTAVIFIARSGGEGADLPWYGAGDGEGNILGYAGLHVVLDEGYIDNIAVQPDARRHGVASALLDVYCRFGAVNLAFLTLEVRASNAPAIGLYEKYGFQRAGLRPGYYQQPREDAVIMTREFPQNQTKEQVP